MKKILLILIATFTSNFISAQQFDNAVEAFSEAITNVKANKKEINQSVETTQGGVISVTVEEVSSKGKTTTKNYEFNAADIDHHTVKAITKKDVITVQLLSNQKQKLIKQTLNNEKVSYINKFVIFAEDIDNGRDLVNKIKATIKPAKQLTEKRLSLSGYEDRLEWLTSNIGDVNGNKKEFAQQLEAKSDYKGSLSFNRTVNTGKSSKAYVYDFNLSTLDPNRVLFKVEGAFFNLLVETKRKNKTIKVSQDGIQKAYTNKITITCKNIEQARDIQKVLKEIIPLAEKEFKASIRPITSISEGVELLNGLIGTIESNETTITQSFDGNCVQTFDQENVTGKKTKHDIYNFNFIDLNKNKVKYSSKGKFIIIELSTKAGNKFIKYTSNDVLKSYTSKFKIFFSKVEDAIVAQNVLVKMIELSATDKENKFVKGSKASMAQKLQEIVGEVAVGDKTFQQELNIKEDGKVLEFKNTIVTKKSSKEKLYEVNTADLKDKSVKIKTTGKNVTVIVKTVHLEKIIKYYENGTSKSYQNTITIQASDIENARQIANLLKAIIEK
jgi:hypothetical protein